MIGVFMKGPRLPLTFLQYWPVGCRVRGNLSERFFRVELDFAMAKLLEYKESIRHHGRIVNYSIVVVGCNKVPWP